MKLQSEFISRSRFAILEDDKLIKEFEQQAHVADFLGISPAIVSRLIRMDKENIKAFKKDGVIYVYQNDKLIAEEKSLVKAKEIVGFEITHNQLPKPYQNCVIREFKAPILYEWYKDDKYMGIFDPVELIEAGIASNNSFNLSQRQGDKSIFAYLSEKPFDYSDTKLDKRYLRQYFYDIYKEDELIAQAENITDVYHFLDHTLDFSFVLSLDTIDRLQVEGWDLEFVDDTIPPKSKNSKFNLYKNNELVGENMTRSDIAPIMNIENVEIYQYYKIQKAKMSFKTRKMYWYYEYSDENGKLIANDNAVNLFENYGVPEYFFNRAKAENKFYQVILTYEEMGYLHGDKLQIE